MVENFGTRIATHTHTYYGRMCVQTNIYIYSCNTATTYLHVHTYIYAISLREQ